MTTLNLNDEIHAIGRIMEKQCGEMLFSEVISLMFHAMLAVKDDPQNLEHQKYVELYDEFYSDLKKQNQLKWCEMFYIKNSESQRFDAFAGSGSFIQSSNIFTLLLRLLFIEKRKRRSNIYPEEYPRILTYKLENGLHGVKSNSVEKLSLYEICWLLKQHIKKYLTIYNENDRLENNIGKKILEIIG